VPSFNDRLQPTQTPIRTAAESAAAGRALRRHVPRTAHAALASPAASRDPLAIIAEQNADRLADLVPLRIGRMLASPFTFYRGTAGIMAFDLAEDTATGIDVVVCGDAHISNFGLFASPQRTLVFDLNDFDEAAVAPWEWDLKRLVTSVVIGARDNGFTEQQARATALEAAASYRSSLREMAELTAVQRYYFRADTDALKENLHRRGQKILDRAVRDAARRTSDAYLDKVSELDATGTRRIVESPPVLTHVSPELEFQVERLYAQYLLTIPVDVAVLLSQFRITDLARRVVGVGSVGTRCYILVLSGPANEPIILQVKEAPPSVLNTYGGMPAATILDLDGNAEPLYQNEGHRVVANQRVLQAVSDSFLGHFSVPDGRHFYVRQFRDRKGSIDVAGLGVPEYTTYVDGCAALLARAHAQSSTALTIAGYLGKSHVFDRAVVDWSFAYADRSLEDYEALKAAVARGELEALQGV
jgi:uncharacterized protein (DUF2252 family)